MLVNLNDSKISKIVYKLDEEHTIEFNYDNGELVSVEGIVQKQDKTKDPFLKILETTRTEDFNDMLRETFGGEQKENEFKKILNKEGDKLNEEEREIIDWLANSHKKPNDLHKLMEYSKDGSLDKYVKSRYEPQLPMVDDKTIDERSCEIELNSLIQEIMVELNSTEPLDIDLNNKINRYKRGIKKLAELRNKSVK